MKGGRCLTENEGLKNKARQEIMFTFGEHMNRSWNS